jgi:hypothetical protein
MEQDAVTTFYFKLGKTAKEVYQDPKNVCSDDCLSRAHTFRRFTRFQEGRESVEHDHHPGRPVSARPNQKVEKAHVIVMQDRQITTRLLAECLGVSKEAARQIPEKDSQKRKIFLRLVPHCEAVSSFQINLCDPASLLLARFGTDRLFLFPKAKLALKGERSRNISDIQHGLIKQLKGVSLQDFQSAFEEVYKPSQHCVELEGDYIENL